MGNVKLQGEIAWEYQRNQARLCIENLTGVKSVINLIDLKLKLAPSDIQQKISTSFKRSATVDAGKITVDIFGSKVVFDGNYAHLPKRKKQRIPHGQHRK